MANPPAPLVTRSRVLRVGAACAALALAVGAAAWELTSRSRWIGGSPEAAVEHTHQVIEATDQLDSTLWQAAADWRGFALTRDDAFLQSRDADVAAARQAIGEIGRLTADNPQQRDLVAELGRLMEQRTALIDQAIALVKAGDTTAGVTLAGNTLARQQLEARHRITEAIVAEEQDLLGRRRAALAQAARARTLAMAALAGVAALALILGAGAFARMRLAVAAAAERRKLLHMMDLAALMVRDFDGTIRIWSDGCRRLYGWTAEEAIGRSAHELLRTVFPLPLPEIEAILLRDGEWAGELRHRTRDGTEIAVQARMVLRRGDAGRPLAVTESITDVTALARAETALRYSNERLRAVVDNAADAIVVARASGRIVSINPAGLRMFGYDSAEELAGRDLGVLMPAEEAARHGGFIAAHRAGAPPRVIGVPGRELMAMRRDGSTFPIDLSVSSFGAEEARYLTGIIRDASARKAAEAALRDSEARLLRFVADAPVAIAMFDTDMRYLAVSDRYLADYGLAEASGAALVGHVHYEIFPDIPERWRAIHGRILAGETLSAEDEAFRRADGRIDWVRWKMTPWRHADGSIGGALLYSENVTGQMAAQQALRASEARLRLVQQIGGIASADRLTSAPRAKLAGGFQELYGLPPERDEITIEEWLALIHPEDRARVQAESYGLEKYEGASALQFRIVRPDGTIRWIALRAESFLLPSGAGQRVISAHQDITALVAAREELERLVAERTAALAEAEARFRAIFDSQFQLIGLLSPDGILLEANRTALEAGGLAHADTIGRPFWETGWWPQAERERLRREIAAAAQGTLIRREVEIIGAGGRSIWIDFSLKPVRDADTGAITWIIPEGRDITEQRNLANQLAQAQKVHALGQLAGGIAHDFNNILQAVSGAAMLIERRPEDTERIRRLARTAVDAATRGASITQRLLSFARRGELRVEALPVPEILEGVREVLAHTLGSTIAVRTALPPALPPLLSDRGQLETALVNLGTNARDAMPAGGTLTLAAAVVRVEEGPAPPSGPAPGDYVRLDVIDTGSGMDAATLARASEPFFTTKPVGQGTGLGLAMVKGFAEQSGGTMSIDSAPGRGTTISLWLRRAEVEAPPRPPAEAPDRHPGDATARVLVVDDDDLVRETLAEQLEAMGFAVTVASSGAEALALIEAGEAPDVLVSDLSMSGMNGIETIRHARELRPRMPCFLLTGYAGERAALDAGDAFTLVRKPISARVFAARIEAGLEAARR